MSCIFCEIVSGAEPCHKIWEDEVLTKLTLASKRVAPMHGTGEHSQFIPIEPTFGKFIDRYEGYLSSHDCERADDKDLESLALHIRSHT